MDPNFWSGVRWDGHTAFGTVGHTHVSCYGATEGRDTCDIMVVESADGRWYVEDHWGGDAQGADGVWNPFDPDSSGPHFFPTQAEAMAHAVAVVARVCGVGETEVFSI